MDATPLRPSNAAGRVETCRAVAAELRAKLANLHSDFMGGDDPDNEPEHRTAADAFDARLARCVDKENVRGDANDDAPSSSSSSSSSPLSDAERCAREERHSDALACYLSFVRARATAVVRGEVALTDADERARAETTRVALLEHFANELSSALDARSRRAERDATRTNRFDDDDDYYDDDDDDDARTAAATRGATSIGAVFWLSETVGSAIALAAGSRAAWSRASISRDPDAVRDADADRARTAAGWDAIERSFDAAFDATRRRCKSSARARANAAMLVSGASGAVGKAASAFKRSAAFVSSDFAAASAATAAAAATCLELLLTLPETPSVDWLARVFGVPCARAARRALDAACEKADEGSSAMDEALSRSRASRDAVASYLDALRRAIADAGVDGAARWRVVVLRAVRAEVRVACEEHRARFANALKRRAAPTAAALSAGVSDAAAAIVRCVLYTGPHTTPSAW